MSSASDIMAAAIVVAVVLASILIIQGVEFSQAAQAFSSQSLVFNQKHALNDLNAVLSTSVPLTKGTVLQMISTQVYYRNSVFNYENQTVDLKNLTQQAFDYAFGPGNYFAYANPTIGTVHLIFIINGNTYFGGAISPGIRMRYTSLNNLTANLPLLDTKLPENIIGNSTENAIHSGVVFGILNEIDGVIDSYRQKYSDLTVILTGGDANFLSKQLKNSIFANPNFLLEGLDTILTYNIK